MADDSTPNGGNNGPSDNHWNSGRDLTIKSAIVQLLHPIPLTVLLILISVLLLIGANVVGADSGNVLRQMADHEFARGLITYLFAVTTIGTSVVLVLAALMGTLGNDAYQRGKEILALLLGVFGTIVGFYFGSEAHRGLQDEIVLSQPMLSDTAAASGMSVHLTAYASGGTPPYAYTVAVGSEATPQYRGNADPSGWISIDVTMPTVEAARDVSISIVVTDNAGLSSSRQTTVTVQPAGP